MKKHKKLIDIVKDFQQEKTKLIPILAILGLLGLILPIIPGIALLVLAVSLFFPRRK